MLVRLCANCERAMEGVHIFPKNDVFSYNAKAVLAKVLLRITLLIRPVYFSYSKNYIFAAERTQK